VVPANAVTTTGNRRIAIVTGFSLARNPRVLKEAMTLRRAGYEVVVLGAELDRTGLEVDNALAGHHDFLFKSVGSLAAPGLLNQLRSSWWRFRSRVGRELFQFAGIENQHQFGYFVPELLRQARATAADYYIVHLEQALWVGAKLLQSGRRVGIDMEDWFSEDLLPEAGEQRPVRLLRSLEEAVLRGAAHSSCSSQAMSRGLAQEFGCRPPTVIYNAFEWCERRLVDGKYKDRKNPHVPSVHWYSQTLGQGRGLEDLFAALPHVKHEVEIHLRGNPIRGFEDWLTLRVPDSWRKRIFIHGLVANHELLSRIAEHDIGFAGEMKYCRSRDLTVTNKILHYLLAGLAVIASDTAGQREIAAQADGSILLYRSGNAVLLAERLNELLGKPDKLTAAKTAALLAAEQTFCWEKCAPQLVQSVERALCLPNSRCS
jgi:glycosyltransferase involved in cell wall biosynthesis